MSGAANYHEDEVTLAGRSFRQLAVHGLGREQATLILTNQRQPTPKQLIERYGQRWGIENREPIIQVSGPNPGSASERFRWRSMSSGGRFRAVAADESARWL